MNTINQYRINKTDKERLEEQGIFIEDMTLEDIEVYNVSLTHARADDRTNLYRIMKTWFEITENNEELINIIHEQWKVYQLLVDQFYSKPEDEQNPIKIRWINNYIVDQISIIKWLKEYTIEEVKSKMLEQNKQDLHFLGTKTLYNTMIREYKRINKGKEIK